MPEMEQQPGQPGEPQQQPLASGPPPVTPEPVAAPSAWWVPPPTTPPAAPPPDSRWRRVAAAVVLVAVIAAAGGVGIGWSLARVVNSRNAQSHAQPLQAVSPKTGSGNQSGSLNLAAIAAKVDSAIVDINTVTAGGNAAGTGMILTSSGEVLTNNHVVNGATSISVTIAGRSGTYVADVVGVDPTVDVALLLIEGVSGLPTVTLAQSSSLQVGQQVVALGNALGAGGTPSETQGTITALNQTITASEGQGVSEQLTGLIQNDAPISPGDSGGPLVNSAGQVVGMVTAGQTQGFDTTTSNIGYAIPSDAALDVVNKIRSGQASSEVIIGPVGFIGVQVRDLDSGTASRFGLNLSNGALVVAVQAGTPAASAGIGQYSVITAVGGTPVTSTATLGAAIHTHKPGERVSVTWVNQTGTHTATVTLVAGPAI